MSKRREALQYIKTFYYFPKYFYYVAKCIFLFKNPLVLLNCYIQRISPQDNMVEMRNGLRIFLSDHPHDIITIFLIWIRNDYGKVLKDNIVIDIGSNIGVFSLYAARMGAKKVYAYEPNTKAYDILLKNITCNALEKVIIPNKYAVSGADNEMVKIPLNSSPYNQLAEKNASGDYEVVSTTTLDRILSENQIQLVDLLKIDCEGSEYDIFFGLKNHVVSRIKDIRMEYHDGPLDSLLSFFKGHSFELIRIDHHSATLWVRRA